VGGKNRVQLNRAGGFGGGAFHEHFGQRADKGCKLPLDDLQGGFLQGIAAGPGLDVRRLALDKGCPQISFCRSRCVARGLVRLRSQDIIRAEREMSPQGM